MKTGAEPKKVAILAGLLAVAGIVLYYNEFAGDSNDSRPIAAGAVRPVAAPVNSVTASAPAGERRRAARNTVNGDFKLRQGVEPGQPKPDPATIDPTLRLDLLAKVQNVQEPGAIRNIFQYGAAPPAASTGKAIALPKNTPTIPIHQLTRPSGPPTAAGPPTAPPITFKYYGYEISKADGRKEAFLLDGDDIIIAAESEAVKRGRYKVVAIGVNSITIEDTQFKSTQTLPLQVDPKA